MGANSLSIRGGAFIVSPCTGELRVVRPGDGAARHANVEVRRPRRQLCERPSGDRELEPDVGGIAEPDLDAGAEPEDELAVRRRDGRDPGRKADGGRKGARSRTAARRSEKGADR